MSIESRALAVTFCKYISLMIEFMQHMHPQGIYFLMQNLPRPKAILNAESPGAGILAKSLRKFRTLTAKKWLNSCWYRKQCFQEKFQKNPEGIRTNIKLTINMGFSLRKTVTMKIILDHSSTAGLCIDAAEMQHQQNQCEW